MAGRKDASDETPLCERCGDVIGVYEPMIYVVDGSAVRTSRAAMDPTRENGAGPAFHAACYDRSPDE
jgi:hypothetical protein